MVWSTPLKSLSIKVEMIQRVLLILGGLVSAARGDDGRDLRLLIMHNHPSWSRMVRMVMRIFLFIIIDIFILKIFLTDMFTLRSLIVNHA